MNQERRQTTSKVPALMEGEFPFRAQDLSRIAAMLHADAGIYLPETKAALVYSRLAKRLRSLGLRSFRDYCDLVEAREGLDERHKMMVALTTNVTSFFREPHHFELLKLEILPPLLQAARTGRRVRIWSAGCSKGHEPYSVAMTILALMPEAHTYDIKILATDIDTDVLDEARTGRYEESLLAAVPRPERRLGFSSPGQAGEGVLSVSPEMRKLVAFRELNLIGEWPMSGRFDIIFCRNVVIYFDDATQSAVWSRFAALLEPDGVLLVGHSERVTGPAQGRFAQVGTTAYRVQGGAA